MTRVVHMGRGLVLRAAIIATTIGEELTDCNECPSQKREVQEFLCYYNFR